MMWWGLNGWGAGMMMFFMVVFWAGIIALIVWGISRLTRHEHAHGSAERDPLDIARQRYAKGEITREQFEQIKKDLKE